jgi:hypothetical protein
MWKLPETHESLEEGDEKARLRRQVENFIVLWTYEMESEEWNPLLSEILRIYQGKTRRDTIHFATISWRSTSFPFVGVLSLLTS